jgi:hypothetical protein
MNITDTIITDIKSTSAKNYMVSALAIIRPDKNLFNSEERVTYYEKDDYQ